MSTTKSTTENATPKASRTRKVAATKKASVKNVTAETSVVEAVEQTVSDAVETTQETVVAAADSLAASARQTAADLTRSGSEALEETRTQIDDAVRRAGKIGREVYLAGLGAVATVDERGRAFFSELVQEGEKVAPKRAPAPLRTAGDRIKKLGGRVESMVGQGVQTGLERVGVPSRREIHQLTSRIEALSAKIDQLGA